MGPVLCQHLSHQWLAKAGSTMTLDAQRSSDGSPLVGTVSRRRSLFSLSSKCMSHLSLKNPENIIGSKMTLWLLFLWDF